MWKNWQVEDIRKKKALAEQEYRNSMPASSYQQQKLRVCEVCSAYLGIHDNDRRLADHFGGKLHLGFIKVKTLALTERSRGNLKRFLIKIREKLQELMTNYEERKTARRESRLRDAAGASADTTAAYYGAGRRYIEQISLFTYF